MKVLMLNGSPRVGGNTALALGEMEQVFRREGVDCEIVQVGQMDIRGCIACGKCGETGKCVFDDIVNQLAPKFQEAAGLVVASPVYYASANALAHAETHACRNVDASTDQHAGAHAGRTGRKVQRRAGCRTRRARCSSTH